jgi:hypothetical protein
MELEGRSTRFAGFRQPQDVWDINDPLLPAILEHFHPEIWGAAIVKLEQEIYKYNSANGSSERTYCGYLGFQNSTEPIPHDYLTQVQENRFPRTPNPSSLAFPPIQVYILQFMLLTGVGSKYPWWSVLRPYGNLCIDLFFPFVSFPSFGSFFFDRIRFVFLMRFGFDLFDGNILWAINWISWDVR